MKLPHFTLLTACAGLLSACGDGTSNTTSTTSDASTHIFKESLMDTSHLIGSVTLESNVAFADGTTGEAYKLIFSSNPVANGPYCPQTINDIGGVGIYDGNTNPGFQVMKKTLWDSMEADGYDIVDDNGNVSITDPGDRTSTANTAQSCLEATANNNLQLTFYIPAVPKVASSDDTIDSVEYMGVSKIGIPIVGDPPSVVGPMNGGARPGGNIPSIDPCGGHMDPFGYYHLHFGAEEMNNVLSAYNITEVSCQNFAQSETEFIGFAKDGYPIYAAKEASTQALPTDLDNCQGHTGVTPDYPEGVYHYHVSNKTAPNLPPCLKGVSVSNAYSYN